MGTPPVLLRFIVVGTRAERDWREWGEKNPLYGVLSDPKYLNANLNDASRDEFFLTGERHVDDVYSVIQSKLRPGFRADRVLDFGCGVGRLLIPFAQRAQVAVGVDISPGMLAEAKKNCAERGVGNARLLQVDEMDSLDPHSFDLVHSFIVFQHIPVAEGERLFSKLVHLLDEDGIGAIHLTFSDAHSAFRRAVFAMRGRSRLMHGLINTMQGKPFAEPAMQMNSYSMNRIFNILFEHQCSNLHVEFTDHTGFRGAMLYFERRAG